MAKQTVTIANWSGGQSQDDTEGIPNSFAYSRHLDFRKSPSKLTVLPETAKDSGTTVTALITAGLQLPSGKKVFIDTDGGAYTRSTGGTWAKLSGSLGTTAYGMVYNPVHDTIYVPNLNNVSTLTNADGVYGGSIAISADTFVANVDQSGGTTANTYTTTGAVNEGATHKLSFTPDAEPLYSVKLYVTTKGTADVRVTLHDAANNTLATKDLTSAQMTNAQLNEWVFTAPVRTRARPNPSTYHVHVHNPGAGTTTTFGTTTASDFSTASYETYASRLIDTVNNFHPVAEFGPYYCIGNGNYLTVWEPISQSAPSNTEWARHRLVFPLGNEVTSLATWTEYLAIACEKRSSSNSNEFQEGKIFFWDGASSGFNFFLDIPQGAPYSVFSDQNTLYYFAGGSWWAWSGGDPVKIFQMPNTDFEYTDASAYYRNYPNMMTVRNNILLAGFPSETNNTDIEHLIYSWGSRSKNYPETFGQSYSISTGSRVVNGTNNLRLGFVKSFGDTTFLSWRDDDDANDFGVDVINNSSDPFGAFTWESLWFNAGRTDKRKLGLEMVIDFVALPTGATITPKYRIVRDGAFTSGTAATATATQIRFNIDTSFNEIQLAFDGVATTVTPQILQITFIYDDLIEEKD